MKTIGHVFIPLNRGHDGLLPSSNDRTHFESLPVPLELWEPFEQSLSEHLSDLTEGQIDREEKTERHRFIPGASCSVAYADKADAIGQGQTISQPLIVALMTHFAEVKFDDTVLEIGTGSGYQAAILARLVRKVCTVEIIPPLAEAAAKLLRNLGYDNVSVKVGDGYDGWPECGPYDATIVTAALDHVPPPLIEQLKVGGRLVMPLGPAYATQRLTVVEKIAAGETKTRSVILVRFVPFTRSGD